MLLISSAAGVRCCSWRCRDCNNSLAAALLGVFSVAGVRFSPECGSAVAGADNSPASVTTRSWEAAGAAGTAGTVRESAPASFATTAMEGAEASAAVTAAAAAVAPAPAAAAAADLSLAPLRRLMTPPARFPRRVLRWLGNDGWFAKAPPPLSLALPPPAASAAIVSAAVSPFPAISGTLAVFPPRADLAAVSFPPLPLMGTSLEPARRPSVFAGDAEVA